jgi:hypothetical protein
MLPPALTALPAAWPRAAVVAGPRRAASALTRCIARPVALTLTRRALTCAVPGPSKSSWLSIGRTTLRVASGMTTARALAVAILVEAPSWLAKREIRRLALRRLSFRSWQRCANERTVNRAIVFGQRGRLGFFDRRLDGVSSLDERIVGHKNVLGGRLRRRSRRSRERWRCL